MEKKLFVLAHDIARQRAIEAIKVAPDGFVVEVKEPTRNLNQNAALWAMLTDLSKQTDWHGMKLSQEEWKDLLSAGLVQAKVVPNMTGTGFVILGQRTSKMTKKMFGELLELIGAFGAERGVVWSDEARAA